MSLCKFDPEWNTTVDLEENDEMINRDKVEVLVISVLELRNVNSVTDTPGTESISDKN